MKKAFPSFLLVLAITSCSYYRKSDIGVEKEGSSQTNALEVCDFSFFDEGNKYASLQLPFAVGDGAHVKVEEETNVEVLFYYYNGENLINDEVSFGMVWSKEQYLIAVSECDSIRVLFRILKDGEEKVLDSYDIESIIESISEMRIGLSTWSYSNGNRSPLLNNTAFVSINHQGYKHYNLLSGYKESAEKGFDYGETDIKITSDDRFVCCHDDSFLDQITGIERKISQHTLQELKAFNYYGETIATLEEVLQECKRYNIGLMIDHLSAGIIGSVYRIVEEQNMQDNVLWALSDNSDFGIKEEGEAILSLCPNASLITTFRTLSDSQIDQLNNLLGLSNTIIAAIDHTCYSIDQLSVLKSELSSNICIGAWTIDRVDTIVDYLPICDCIISNKISYKMMKNSNIFC